MTTIYLSSTYEDLKEYRRVVFDALRKSGYQVIAMEDYVATDQRPVEKCLDDVKKADIYVGLFAFRYGYVPPPVHNNPNGLSITELEFRRGEELKKPCLTFVVNDTTAWPRSFDDARTAEDKGERINRLRQHLLTEKLASSFSSPHELAALILAAVTKHLEDNKKAQAPVPEESASPALPTWDIEKKGSPYPGLMHFTRKYAPVFFGREGEVREILDRMCLPEGRFIIISGGSGTGKSSLVDAGVLPKIGESDLSRAGNCFCARMVPSGGAHPFDALIRVLHAQVEQASLNPYNLGNELLAQPAIFSERIQKIIAEGMNSNGLVLFLDQMEELFTAQTKDHAKQFLSALYSAVNEASLRVIATIRGDFLHHCHEQPEMLKILNGRGHYGLGRVEPFMMHDMIVKPAECAALTVPDRLVSRLVQDTGSEPGNLPLLAFVLQRLFDKRSGNVLSEAVYDRLGSVAGAIRDHIKTVEEETIAKKIGDGALDFLPRIFQSLLVMNEEGRPTRHRVPIAKFPKDGRAMVDVLITERLLSTEGEGETATVSVAHEKLFEAWPALAKWIGENQNDLFVLRQAEIEAGEWEKHGCDLRYLWHVDRLKQLQAIVQKLSDRTVDPIVTNYASPQDKLIKRLEKDSLSHQDRLMIGNYLGELGDPRRGVGLTADGVPDIDLVDIPRGEVKLEEVEDVFEIKPFRIARYPVTNVQFDAFINAEDGYRNDEWWKGIKQSEVPYQPSWKEANSPRETVSWYEAVAFCRWISKRARSKFRLPTEWEWQQAATGGDTEREYPWPGAWDATRCNSFESRLNRTSAVGMYPTGATQQGVLDVAGNVREWCLNKYEKPGTPESLRIDDTDAGRVIRGGSWSHKPGDLRSSFRYRYSAGNRNGNLGVRLVQDLE